MICTLCRTTKSQRYFPKHSPICKVCVDKLESKFDVNYAPPERVTKLEGYIRLLGASRRQAVEEGELEQWEAVFLEEKPWRLMWTLLDVNNFFI